MPTLLIADPDFHNPIPANLISNDPRVQVTDVTLSRGHSEGAARTLVAYVDLAWTATTLARPRSGEYLLDVFVTYQYAIDPREYPTLHGVVFPWDKLPDRQDVPANTSGADEPVKEIEVRLVLSEIP